MYIYYCNTLMNDRGYMRGLYHESGGSRSFFILCRRFFAFHEYLFPEVSLLKQKNGFPLG